MKGNQMTSLTEMFRNIAQIKELKLSSNRVTDNTGVFEYLKALRKLTLSDNLVSYVPDDNFNENTELLELYFIGNNIQWVGRNAFRGVVTLRDLRLRKNHLLSLNGSMRHLVNMKYFDAAFNEIQYLEKGEFERNAFLAYISLMGNNLSSVDGAFTGTVHLRGLGLAGNRIDLLRRKDFPQRMIAAPNVTLDSLLLGILTLSAAYFYCEHHLKTWLNMRGVCSWAHCITEGDLDAEKVFDVFLSFSSKDAGWVHEQLIPGLEAVALSYCTYERNFKGGFLLQDIIRDAVACSRRTVLLLT
ncbi:hypothetical protein V5799_011528, partial [Amblyomma americanum]